ncbi:MAG: cyclic nucleotide-binding domain-containing protein [Candidatus Hydrogenedentes bacterium]|nr:cyclic nucleotide-binding domain-containing protein [Candidatus Hydrogenedentota bacterium]
MDAATVDKYIKHVSLFHGLSREEVAKIFAKGMTMHVDAGQDIFVQGTVGSQMYVVLGGKLGVFDGEKCLAELRTGDMFGEMALVNKEPRSATVTAINDSRLFVLTESTFERLMSKRVAIRVLFNIIKTLSHRLREANKRLAAFKE